MIESIKLTEYSHGAGCGCKISPAVLKTILGERLALPASQSLLVGNDKSDDAAVMDIGHGKAVISTTDFFMPIVDDPFTFGRIAACNALSDIYAMGGKPLMAIAILGWPLDKLPAKVAAKVLDGGREACREAGIPLAGGHSIDNAEPLFGLAVTGEVAISQIKQNSTAKAGDLLFLTKPLGIGILSTASKQKKLRPEDSHIAPELMCRLNTIGAKLGKLEGVHAMTDVTGFGLMGHLLEICQGSGLQAELWENHIPLLPHLDHYISSGCVPGGCHRNFASYGDKLTVMNDRQKTLYCDPQTSGGLLVAVSPENEEDVRRLLVSQDLPADCIGKMTSTDQENTIIIREGPNLG